MFAVGDEVAGHIVDAYVGSGSSADVYRVHRADSPGTSVAMKILHADAGTPQRTRDRFEREFAITAMLHHPRIVEVFDNGELTLLSQRQADDPKVRARGVHTLWMTMQYIHGAPATTLIPDRRIEPEVPQIIWTAVDVGAALDYAHSLDVIHRDVKPSNIIVAPGNGGDDVHGFLTDFGIAQLLDDARPLARNGRVLGSIAYASPELLQAQQLTQKTDQYALACTVCELLTGHPPFTGPTSFAITYAHIHTDPPRLSKRRTWLPSSLDAVFAKALAKDPRQRYDTCSEFVEIVARTLRDVPVPEPERRRRLRWPIVG